MITFKIENDPIYLFKTQLLPMLVDHFQEVSHFKETVLDPKWDVYQVMHDNGGLLVITANYYDRIVGYTSNFLHSHIHYPVKIALNDIIYLLKDYRGHGQKLISFTEKELKKRKVEYFIINIKPEIDFSPVLKRKGYFLAEYSYMRRL